MSRRINRITGIEGVSQGGSASFKLDTGRRLHAIQLLTYINGVLAAADSVVDRVRVKVNEVTQWDVPAEYLLREARLNGYAPAVGVLPLFFAEPGRADKTDEQALAYDLTDARSFTVELTFKTTGTPTDIFRVAGSYSWDNGGIFADINGRRTRITNALRKSILSVNALGGNYDIDGLPVKNPLLRVLMVTPSRSSGAVTITQATTTATASAALFAADDVGKRIVYSDGRVANITGYTSSTVVTVAESQTVTALKANIVGVIKSVEVNADSKRHWETEEVENAEYLRQYGLVPTEFALPLCFDYTEQTSDFLEIAQSLNVRINSGTPQAVQCMAVSVAPSFSS